ncbi:nucleoside hydrolase [Paenibacillus sp. 1P07SE]|uniref:nucleoside hydrolase n=1 Tax=Paenibacillus sp. 1P07SE TaxID=3132209 RepID=UPI0039A4F021
MPHEAYLMPDQLIRRLEHPGRKVRMILDTDTYNEIDDQFAVIYALQSEDHVQVEAMYAAPFFNSLSDGPKDGMEKSYRELHKIRSLMKREEVPLYRGAEAYLPGPEQPADSEAARDLVRRAMASDPEDPLYVVAIAAITNIASAILIEPRIVERIVVVWLGGHALHWPDTKEFNLAQDLYASRLVLDCGVPLILAPCMGVASHLKTTLSELGEHIREQGEAGAYLYKTFEACHDDHYGYSRVIWDIAVIAWLVEPDWCPSYLTASPRISDDYRWIPDPTRHPIRYMYHIQRDAVFRDLFRKIGFEARTV